MTIPSIIELDDTKKSSYSGEKTKPERTSVKAPSKRTDYLEWQEYFMSIAFLSAQRSKDPRTQVGACIVNKENKVVGIGYNGMPIGCNDDEMPWNRAEDTSIEKWLQSKKPYVCHAELNAVLNKNLADVRGCTIYVALFPCNSCAQIIIQSGITEVVYYSDIYSDSKEFKASKQLMKMAGVTYRQYCSEKKKVIIDFESIERSASEVPTLPKQRSYVNMSIPNEDHLNSLLHKDSETCDPEIVNGHEEEDDQPDNGPEEPDTETRSAKRKDYLEWQEYFMAMAFLSAQRSKDPRTQVGACIVSQDNKVVGIGYNGMPLGCSDDLMPWNRAEDNSKEKWLDSKNPYVCHAELNAVLNKNLADIRGCSIYVALFPCNMCAQIIIQSGIKEVVYFSDKYHDKPEFHASRHLMNMAGVKYRQFRPKQKKIIIDLDRIDRNFSKSTSHEDKPKTASMENDDNNSHLMKSAAINNNNVSMKMKRRFLGLEDQAAEESLLQVNNTAQLETAATRQATQAAQTASIELKFAVVSWALIILSMLILWYLSFLELVE